MNITQKAKLSLVLLPLICFLPILTQNEYVFTSEFYGWILYFILTIGSLVGFSYYTLYVHNPNKKYLIPFGTLIGIYIIAGIFGSLMLPVGFIVGLLSYITGIFLLSTFFAVPTKQKTEKILQKLGVTTTLLSIFFIIVFFMTLYENSQISGVILIIEIVLQTLSGILFMLLGLRHPEAESVYHSDSEEVSLHLKKNPVEEKLHKRNKIISISAAVILITLLFFGVTFTFAEPDTWISSYPTGYTTENPPPEKYEVYVVTENEFAKTPILRKFIDKLYFSAPVTDDMIVKMKYPHALSKEEALTITEKYGRGYLLHDGVYYSLRMVFS